MSPDRRMGLHCRSPVRRMGENECLLERRRCRGFHQLLNPRRLRDGSIASEATTDAAYDGPAIRSRKDSSVSNPKMLKVLVTGSAGAVGQAVCKELQAAGHRVRGLDKIETPGVADAMIGNLTDEESVDIAVMGMDAVVHLGAHPTDGNFKNRLLGPNFLGVYHVMDACRRHGIKHATLASSCQVVSGIKRKREILDDPIRLEEGRVPTNHYALSKCWAEDVGEMYARQVGMSVIAVRIGWLPRSERDIESMLSSPRSQGMYLSHDDAGRFFRLCVETAPGGYHVVFATSKPGDGQYPLDMEPAKELIGYEPQDIFPDGLSLDMQKLLDNRNAEQEATQGD